jgi:crotonobetainyl-CoA:carnitine CoA-transferase CaiB-like acyl-CoA transferase
VPTALQGLRIVDLSQVWAGPLALKILGDMGADVIKVESGRRTDSARGPADPKASGAIYPNDDPGPRPWNRAGLFNDRNRSKRGICLDLTMPEGVETLKRLVAVSDVVVESYRFGVLERLGAGYEAMRAVKPDIVYISFSSQGANGPEREYGSYGAILEQTAGIASITGYRGEAPTGSGTFFPDPVVAMLGVGTILAAVRQRDSTGEGMFVDLSQREVTTSIVPELLMDYTMNGRSQGPQGNRHEVYAPQGVYPSSGDDAWVALSVRSDVEWLALAELIGGIELVEDERFSTLLARRANHDDVDELISSWTCERDPRTATDRFQSLGIASGIVHRGDTLLADPQLVARNFWEPIDHPEAGRIPHLSRPFKHSRTPGSTPLPAPMLGQHTYEVLRDVVGMSEEEIDELDVLGVTRNVPDDAAGI